MQRVTLKAYGGVENFVLEEAETPHPAQGQLLVDVEASGVNYLDVYHRKGRSLVPPPCTLGLEGVGRIRQLGEGINPATSGMRPGMRIAWVDVGGSYASQIAIPIDRAIVVPQSLATHQALLFQALTAQYLVSEYRTIQRGDRVLVHAAAGGVGQLLVQWFKHLGAWVAGTASSEEKAKIIRNLCADAVIVYGENYDFASKLKELTGGEGVILAIDGIGAGTFASSLESLALGGTLVSIGATSGPTPELRTNLLSQRSLRVAGGNVFSYIAKPTELRRRAAEVFAGIEAGWLKIDDGKTFTLAAAAEAHKAIEGRSTTGKLYLTPK